MRIWHGGILRLSAAAGGIFARPFLILVLRVRSDCARGALFLNGYDEQSNMLPDRSK